MKNNVLVDLCTIIFANSAIFVAWGWGGGLIHEAKIPVYLTTISQYYAHGNIIMKYLSRYIRIIIISSNPNKLMYCFYLHRFSTGN